ncbi:MULTISPECIES: hypothetical protein [unclassified Shewanella]|uniref:hypothetical protein n=1 Tax=unclassified Shewanella TaxID=196818 RepID=UPI00052EF572|nr:MULTISPECIES: hypothetical protein [unclassified Shewanella]
MELCTIAEIGVGAAIAIGNQAMKGNCALLVNNANIKKKIIILFLFISIKIIDIIIKQSPNLLLKKVLILLFQES